MQSSPFATPSYTDSEQQVHGNLELQSLFPAKKLPQVRLMKPDRIKRLHVVKDREYLQYRFLLDTSQLAWLAVIST